MTQPQRMYFGQGGHDAVPRVLPLITGDVYANLGDLVSVDTTGGPVSVYLPPATMSGEVAVRLAAGTNTLTVVADGSDTVDGGATEAMDMAGEARMFVSCGSGSWSTSAGGASTAALSALIGDIIASTVPGLLGGYRPMPAAVNTQASISGVYTIPDLDVAQMHDLTLTGDATLVFPPNPQGKEFRIVLRQDSTGGWVTTWPVNAYKPSGAFNLSVTPDTTDSIFVFSVCTDRWGIFLEGKAFC